MIEVKYQLMRYKSYYFILFIILSFLQCENSDHAPHKSIAFIGTYTQEEGHVNGKGEGIVVYETGPGSEDWKKLNAFSDIVNPSYLSLSRNHPIVYAVSEQGPNAPAPGSIIKVIKYDTEDYSMKEIQQVDALGAAPCYISTSLDGKYLYTANYVGGNVVQYAIQPNGILQDGRSTQHKGSAAHPRQEAPHVHYARQHPSNGSVYVTDLGTNQVFQYKSGDSGLQLEDFLDMEPDSGPRHLVWHPGGKDVYILNELNGTIENWEWVSGYSKRHQIISLRPQGEEKDPGGADIHISKDGRYVYASLRGGYNEIVVLAIEPGSSRLRIIQRASVGGQVPRNFAISPDDAYVAVALQNSDKIMLFNRDKSNGMLAESPQAVDVMTPVCIQYLQ
jgi:6-phosphogluconolactonase